LSCLAKIAEKLNFIKSPVSKGFRPEIPLKSPHSGLPSGTLNASRHFPWLFPREGEKVMFKPVIHLIFILSALAVSASAQPELDITFNGNGRANFGFGSGTATAYKTLVQPDNKVVAIGTWSPASGKKYFALARWKADGTIDETFGEFGHLVTEINPNSVNEVAYSGAIQPDGKIIAAGQVTIIAPGEAYFAMIRYTPDGQLDPTFGNGGKVTSGFSHQINEIRDIAVAPDGRIVAAGITFNGTTFPTEITCYDGSGSPLWTRTDSRGFFLGDTNKPSAVAFQPDGKIITGGTFSTNTAGSDITFVRYNADGSYDTSFGNGGRIFIDTPNLSEGINDIELYPDGRILAVGFTGSDLLLIRMFGNGMFDITFSDDGRATATGATGAGVYIRPNGKILVAGQSTGFSLLSFNPNGSPDTSFSGDGRLSFNFNGASAAAITVTLDPLGRPVMGGAMQTGFGVARLYTLDPVPVSISGQARTPGGTPLRGVRVGLTDASGVTRWALTSNFGFFGFDDIPTGQTYNLFVRGSKTHIFESKDIGLNEAVNVDMIGTPRPESKSEVKIDLPRTMKKN
jgi:uncharacterized delta-60 repeat protein